MVSSSIPAAASWGDEEDIQRWLYLYVLPADHRDIKKAKTVVGRYPVVGRKSELGSLVPRDGRPAQRSPLSVNVEVRPTRLGV